MEMLGALFLTLAITLTGNALAIGVMFAVLVYIGAHISGAHYNPAVSLAVWMRKGIKTDELVKYVGVQIVGALLAAVVYNKLTGNHFPLEETPGVHLGWAVIMEAALTAVLVLTFLTVTMGSQFKNGEIYGLAIGLALLAIASIGGLFNPAVALGAMLCSLICGNGFGTMNAMLVFLVAPLVGGALAAMAYQFLNGKKA
jgi:glycerol uptake facilitator-like aquaporin